MQRPRYHRLIGLIAVLALFIASTAYVAHIHKPDAQQQTISHCDLCLQFNASAAIPPASIVWIAGALWLLGVILPQTQAVPFGRRQRAPPARAPPLSF